MASTPLNFATAKVKQNNGNFNFEIFDCTVQGNSTYQKSGPCPDSATGDVSDGFADSDKVVSETKADKTPESKADISPDTNIADTETMQTPESNNDNFEKYDFDQIHIAESETSEENTEISQINSTLTPKILTPTDPFGLSMR
jgi:hypothetical protein